MTSFWCFYCLNIFHTFFIPIVDFEQANLSWICSFRKKRQSKFTVLIDDWNLDKNIDEVNQIAAILLELLKDFNSESLLTISKIRRIWFHYDFSEIDLKLLLQ